MKQQINLYSAELLPPKSRLTLLRLCVSALVLLLSLGSVVFALQFQGQKLDEQITASQQREQRLSERLNEVALQVRANQPNPELVAKAKEIQATLDSFEQLAQALSQDESLIRPGFSHLMRDLSAAADNQVWLQRFQLAQNQLELSGQARRADAVPKWLERLGKQPSIKGRVLSKMELTGEADKPVSFIVSHGLDEEPDSESRSVSPLLVEEGS